MLANEVQVLKQLGRGCKNIIRLVYDDLRVIHLEYLPCIFGNHMITIVYDRETARTIYTAIARALQHCHANSILHRDVQPKNIGCRRRPGESFRVRDVVLLDFDMAVQGKRNRMKDEVLVGPRCICSVDHCSYKQHLSEHDIYTPDDDFESLIYTCYDFETQGSLPWSASDDMEEIMHAKQKWLASLLSRYVLAAVTDDK